MVQHNYQHFQQLCFLSWNQQIFTSELTLFVVTTNNCNNTAEIKIVLRVDVVESTISQKHVPYPQHITHKPIA